MRIIGVVVLENAFLFRSCAMTISGWLVPACNRSYAKTEKKHSDPVGRQAERCFRLPTRRVGVFGRRETDSQPDARTSGQLLPTDGWSVIVGIVSDVISLIYN